MSSQPQSFKVSFDGGIAVSGGVSVIRWIKEEGDSKYIPLLIIKTDEGITAAGLLPKSIKSADRTLYATFVTSEGKKFVVNTHLYGQSYDSGRPSKLQQFCWDLLDRRRAAKAVEKAGFTTKSWHHLQKEAAKLGIVVVGKGRTRDAILADLTEKAFGQIVTKRQKQSAKLRRVSAAA
jgi:hypothetical protein